MVGGLALDGAGERNNVGIPGMSWTGNLGTATVAGTLLTEREVALRGCDFVCGCGAVEGEDDDVRVSVTVRELGLTG